MEWTVGSVGGSGEGISVQNILGGRVQKGTELWICSQAVLGAYLGMSHVSLITSGKSSKLADHQIPISKTANIAEHTEHAHFKD